MEDRSHEVLAVAVLFLTLTWITVLLRVYVRAGMLKSWGLDDWMMLVTQVSPLVCGENQAARMIADKIARLYLPCTSLAS